MLDSNQINLHETPAKPVVFNSAVAELAMLIINGELPNRQDELVSLLESAVGRVEPDHSEFQVTQLGGGLLSIMPADIVRKLGVPVVMAIIMIYLIGAVGDVVAQDLSIRSIYQNTTDRVLREYLDNPGAFASQIAAQDTVRSMTDTDVSEDFMLDELSYTYLMSALRTAEQNRSRAALTDALVLLHVNSLCMQSGEYAGVVGMMELTGQFDPVGYICLTPNSDNEISGVFSNSDVEPSPGTVLYSRFLWAMAQSPTGIANFSNLDFDFSQPPALPLSASSLITAGTDINVGAPATGDIKLWDIDGRPVKQELGVNHFYSEIFSKLDGIAAQGFGKYVRDTLYADRERLYHEIGINLDDDRYMTVEMLYMPVEGAEEGDTMMFQELSQLLRALGYGNSFMTCREGVPLCVQMRDQQNGSMIEVNLATMDGYMNVFATVFDRNGDLMSFRELDQAKQEENNINQLIETTLQLLLLLSILAVIYFGWRDRIPARLFRHLRDGKKRREYMANRDAAVEGIVEIIEPLEQMELNLKSADFAQIIEGLRLVVLAEAEINALLQNFDLLFTDVAEFLPDFAAEIAGGKNLWNQRVDGNIFYRILSSRDLEQAQVNQIYSTFNFTKGLGLSSRVEINSGTKSQPVITLNGIILGGIDNLGDWMKSHLDQDRFPKAVAKILIRVIRAGLGNGDSLTAVEALVTGVKAYQLVDMIGSADNSSFALVYNVGDQKGSIEIYIDKAEQPPLVEVRFGEYISTKGSSQQQVVSELDTRAEVASRNDLIVQAIRIIEQGTNIQLRPGIEHSYAQVSAERWVDYQWLKNELTEHVRYLLSLNLKSGDELRYEKNLVGLIQVENDRVGQQALSEFAGLIADKLLKYLRNYYADKGQGESAYLAWNDFAKDIQIPGFEVNPKTAAKLHLDSNKLRLQIAWADAIDNSGDQRLIVAITKDHH